MVNSVRPEVVGCKLTNIYDINSKVYMLKLQRRGFKCFLLLDSGMRFHLTEYSRDKSSVPSMYTMKLRKHLRTRRLTEIKQVGCDRSVDITFGYGENAFHLILELYVSGNLILTDTEYTILALLRSHGDANSKGTATIAVKQTYPIGNAMGLLSAPIEDFPAAVDAILEKAADRQDNQENKELDMEDEKASAAAKKGLSKFEHRRSRKRVKHDSMPLVHLLQKLVPFADPSLCGICLTRVLKAADKPCENAFKLHIAMFDIDEAVELLQKAAEQLLETLRSVSRPDDLGGGTMQPLAVAIEENDAGAEVEEDDDDEPPSEKQGGEGDVPTASAPVQASPEKIGDYPLVPGWINRKLVTVPPAEPRWANEDFSPLPPAPDSVEEASVPFATFHRCVDEFFTRIEEHKSVEQKAMHAQSVYAKVEKIRQDQNRRVEVLEVEQQTSERQASLIESNLELVDRALAMLNAMVASQIDWGEIWREVKRQQKLGHPIAEHIHSLELERNEFKLLLGGNESESDEEEDRPMEVVPLNLNLSSRSNVARLHSFRKETREKASRTQTHAEAAVKQAEKKAQNDLKKFQFKQTIRRVRQTWWFEKFIWFISSENYLVLAGRDAQQTEQLFCRYLGKDDAFIQADVAGARSCFVKNVSVDKEVPPATLREAGTLALCHSSAWDKRMVISAWWTPCGQVTRGRPPDQSEDFVVVDGFFVRGRRHFMPPLHLEMGLTLLFHVTGKAVEAHAGERRSRYLEAMEQLAADGSCDHAAAAAAAAALDEAAVADEDAARRGAADDEEVAVEDDDEDEEDEKVVAEEEDKAPVEEAESDAEGEKAEEEAASDAEADVEAEVEAMAVAQAAEAETTTVAVEGDAAEDEPEKANDAADDDCEANRGGGGGAGGRTRTSKAERKRMKKGGSGVASTLDGADSASPLTGAPADEAADFKPAPRGGGGGGASQGVAGGKKHGPANGPAPLPRGQKAKAKKMKEKYADQGDEERELRLALLGSKATKRSGGADGTGGQPLTGHTASASDAPAAADGEETPSPSAKAKAAPAADTAAAGAAVKKFARPQRKPQQTVPKDAKELTAGCDAEAGAAELNNEDLDVLTGQPGADDEVLYVMPMVAPYCAVGGPYAFRAKLTPGTAKKGQAARQCLKMFEAQIQRPAWKQLMQAVPENDTAGLMCGSCKLSMPGMQKLQQQLRREKTKEKKDIVSDKPAKKKTK
eukprot:TRINITY_DN14043_c0_g1_i1.p1 TRINITY_DN14043_c0_g1~~TRINITY_DN14043_c0_g1_i1.p1  ORF type:complete len:1282 (+),score=339.78 TRINITY_DN14043_c0_g1_i1:203-3847(+)